jgi:hypothetical protein
MRSQRLILYVFTSLGLLFCLQLAACGSQGIPGSQRANGTPHLDSSTSSFPSISDRAIPPVILHDPAPGELEVSFNVNIAGYGADRGNTLIGLSFLSHGNTVQLIGHEELLCNGRAMAVHSQYALFQLVDAPSKTLEGNTMSCTYRVRNISSTFSFTVPRTPAFRSPQDGARVLRSVHTVVTYDYDVQGGKLLGIVALGPGAKTVTDHLNPPGPIQATLDTSRFPTGEGSFSLSQEIAPRVTWTGMPFRSLAAEGTANAMVTVTWI